MMLDPRTSVRCSRAAAALLIAALCACHGAPSGEGQPAPGDGPAPVMPTAPATPQVVHGDWPRAPVRRIVVVPFMFGVQDMQASQDAGGFGFLALRQQRLAARQASNDEKLAEQFTDSLVRELRQDGFQVEKLAPGAALPASGWLVRGAFVELDDPASGQHVNLPLFGSGSSGQVGLWVSVDDLGAGVRPLFDVNTTGAGAGRGGGLPSPYSAAVKFVLTQVELSQDADELAQRVADAIAKRAAGASNTP